MITLNDVLWSNDNDGEDIDNEAEFNAFHIMTEYARIKNVYTR